MTDFSAYTLDALRALKKEVTTEVDKREDLASIPPLIKEYQARYLNVSGHETGKPWVQPTGAHDAYPAGWVVTLDGAEWESTTDANVWKPGVSGWRRKVAPGSGPAAWVQPTGAHDAYKKGDQVTYKGAVWTSTSDGNVWAPDAYGWTKAS